MSSPVRRLAKQVVYDGRKIRLEVHEIEDASGRKAVREVVCHAGSVAVLAFRRGADGGREVLLERNYRYTTGGYVIEIPAGTLDQEGEDPVVCARRELIEETGYRPAPGAGLVEMLSILPSPGLLTERLTVFVTESVIPGQADREPGEIIDCLWVPWTRALKMVRDGEIEDAKTIAALLYYETFGWDSGSE